MDMQKDNNKNICFNVEHKFENCCSGIITFAKRIPFTCLFLLSFCNIKLNMLSQSQDMKFTYYTKTDTLQIYSIQLQYFFCRLFSILDSAPTHGQFRYKK